MESVTISIPSFKGIAMKLLLPCLVLAMVLCLIRAEHYNFGTKGPNDKLLHKGKCMYSMAIMANRWEYPRFPPQGSFKVPITYIKVTDKINNGASRYAKIIEGGIGEKSVKFECYSGYFRGFDYEFEVYGKGD